MIKLLSNKIIASICLVLTVFTVSTSVLATDSSNIINNSLYVLSSLAADNISTLDSSLTSGKSVFYYKNCSFGNSTYNNNVIAVVANTNFDFFGLHRANSTYNRWYIEPFAADSSGIYYESDSEIYIYKDGSWVFFSDNSDYRSLFIGTLFAPSTPFIIYSESNTDLYYSSNSTLDNPENFNFSRIYESSKLSINTDFDYKFIAESKDKLCLYIKNLDPNYKMIGFIDNPNNYKIGDTLLYNSDIQYQRIAAASSNEDYDYYGYLKPSEVLTYYIINDSYTIVDTGTIEDLASGYFLYSYTNEKGIKFSFLKNGSFYWDDTLDFVWTDPNGYQYNNDQIITLSERYITVYEDVYSYTVTGTVYDADGNILGQADCTYIQEQGYLDATIGDTSYYEYSSTPTLSEFVVYSIKLQGKDSKGNDLDFSNYYIKWNVSCYLVSYSLNSEKIYVGNELYNSTSGVFDNVSTNGFCFFNLKVIKRLSNYVCFNFTFDIYNSSNELVKTLVISSDEIVGNQIKANESIGNNSNYEIENNSNYNSWNSSYSYDGIDNWKVDDFKNYIGTGNFIWQFMKAVLFGLPSWITIPMYILLSGVVVITLLKLIRGG